MTDNRPRAADRPVGAAAAWPWRSGITLGAIALLVGTGVAIALAAPGLLSSRTVPAPDEPAPPPSDLAREATEYLRARRPAPLSGPLQKLLADPGAKRVPTERHPLLNQPAPPFTLVGVDARPVELDALLQKGPVVLVFYYGYTCNHCVAQLFGLNEDLRYFTELGATVVAVSPDSPERTKAQYARYGAFGFPVLSDKDREVAARYGVYRPAVGKDREWEAHGTFVIARDRRIRWVNTGAEPFTDNPTLLAELARLEDRLPGR